MKPKLAKKARLKFDRHSGQHMLMYPERGLALNESAAEIAKRCDGTKTIEMIVDDLCQHPDDREAIEKDVKAFVDQLAQKGLLES